MQHAQGKWLVSGLAVLLAVGLWLTWAVARRPPAAPAASAAAEHIPAKESHANQAPTDRQSDGLPEALQRTQALLQTAQDMEEKRRQLAALRQILSSPKTNEVSEGIRNFLQSKADAATGQAFRVRDRGTLREAPTLRVFLLDYLGQIDPAGAAAYARTILTSFDSADEWAVALRNLASGDSGADARDLLQRKVSDLFAYDPWQKNPSVGYLEAFDVAVYLGGTKLLPQLSELIRKQDNPAIAHAAFLALDRLVIKDPSTLLVALLTEPDLMKGRELTRADYFARADVRDPQQRQVLEGYLADSRIGPAERDQFAGVFPNANFMISQNLLTTTATPDHSALSARDAESLRVVQEWINDPAFTALRPQLEKVKSRLEVFVRQADGK
jgi:hypothetical protein